VKPLAVEDRLEISDRKVVKLYKLARYFSMAAW